MLKVFRCVRIISLVTSIFIFQTGGLVALPLSITKQNLITTQSAYIAYLKSLCKKINYTPAWLRDCVAKKLGCEQWECDAIPASYPFLCEAKYAQLMHLLSSDQIIGEINRLLTLFNQKCVGISTMRKKEQLLHTLLHEYNCTQLGLPIHTTAKELSRLVEAGKVNIDVLCRAQLVGFYVKFLLETSQ